jgi:hypothetical protein
MYFRYSETNLKAESVSIPMTVEIVECIRDRWAAADHALCYAVPEGVLQICG